MTDLMEKVIDETRQGAPLSLEGDAKNTRKLYI